MGDPMVCALVGYGYWGKVIEKYIIENKNFNLKYIYSRSLKNGTELKTILDDQSVQAVFVCTSIGSHYDIVKKILLSGKHVFCEKPLTKTLASTYELILLAEKAKKCLYTDYTYIVSPSVDYAKTHINDIGKTLYIQGSIKQFGKFYETDSVQEVLAVHLIATIIYLFNIKSDFEITEFIILKENNSNILECKIAMKCPEVERIDILCSMTSCEKNRKIEIYGEGGYIKLDLMSEETVSEILFDKTNLGYKFVSKTSNRYDEKNNLKYALQDFNLAIEREINPNSDLSLRVAYWLDKTKNFLNSSNNN